jgi:hypothetical protein
MLKMSNLKLAKHRPAKDLQLVILATALCILFVLIPSLNETPIRIFFGISLVLFFPGYSLTAALFPRKDDLDIIERIALSFGLSIAITPLLGLALNYTPFGIRLLPVLIILSGFIIGVSILACIRRIVLPEEEIFFARLRFREIYKLAKSKLFEEPSNTKISQDRVLKITSGISFILIALALILIKQNSPATGYELSIYASLPNLTWIFLISALAFGICIIVYEAFTSKSKFWLAGFLILILANFTILSLPFIRGYFLYGTTDALGHYGITTTILASGYIGENYYPVTHILGAVLIEICAISLETVMKYLPVIFTVLFMLFTYLLASIVSSKKEHAILAAAASSVLLFSYYHISTYPHALSLFTFPLMFYLYFKSLNTPSFSNKIASIILILLFPFFHPVPEMVLISCLVIAEVAKLGWARRMHYSSRIESIAMNPALISFTTFILWISYFTILGSAVQRVFLWTAGETPVVARAGELISTFELGWHGFFELLLKMYGHNLIIIILSVIALGIIIIYFLQRRKEIRNFFILLLLFLTSSLIYIIISISLGLVTWGRILGANIGIWATPVLASFALYEIFKRPGIPKFIGIAAVVIILTSSSAIGVFSVYRSPWILQPNWQITSADISGSHWASHYKPELEMAFSEMGWVQAYAQTEMPEHFGYHEHTMLGESLKQDTIILLGKRFKLASDDPILSKKGMMCPSIMARQGFNKEDFEKLNEDRSVNRLYHNGEFELLLVKSSGIGVK